MRFATTLLTLAALAAPAAAAEKDTRVYELRVYWANKGKLDAMHARFRDHTTKLFAKHGMTNVGYWVPVDNADDRLVYLLAHESREAADKSWKGFLADEDWKKAARESEANGKIVAKLERFWLSATDYGAFAESAKAGSGRAFELRTYITPAKGLDAIDARFRDHTTKLFGKHGMTNVLYTHLMKDDKATVGKLLTACTKAGDDKCGTDAKEAAPAVALVYLLAHASPEAAKTSFGAFRTDPDWIKAKQASEDKAGGALTVPDGVKSLMMKATDYSPMK